MKQLFFIKPMKAFIQFECPLFISITAFLVVKPCHAVTWVKIDKMFLFKLSGAWDITASNLHGLIAICTAAIPTLIVEMPVYIVEVG